MVSKSASNIYTLNKLTYINLRWIAIFGQFVTVNVAKYVFNFELDILTINLVILLGVISNLFLMYFYEKNILSNRASFIFLLIDIIQLSGILYYSGGILNPFSIFILIPSVFSSSNLSLKTSLLLIFITILCIIFLTVDHRQLIYPLGKEISFNEFYYYGVPISLVIALIFLNYFAILFGRESNLRKEAFNKIEEFIAKEHELVSLGGQAAAAAHSLNTPLSTIKIISQDLSKQFKDKQDLKKDIELLVNQVDRCSQILKKLTLNPGIEDDFIDVECALKDYVTEIIKSFQEISEKEFIFNDDQDDNSFKIPKLIELVYGIRNFIGNANKFANNKVYISVKSDNEISEISIEDDGPGYPKEILNKIGEPYIKSTSSFVKSKTGLGLGIFIGKTLLERHNASIICRNSKTRSGAEVLISWKNKDLKNL
ncbi:ActS/PrrB/RegB family redox-sensitive histidine kinase [Candidatus Pelagibacter communis]|uniref:ActS/PrrB/RegB family redox-sensitive histidine kinase n=1 Tax=Pelagibacter ubique TaxID=198252 RepID=UPI00094CAD65|nr:ActS/PrrB/RegB family redox-sensitive histidine kinase [Candidatus Pelagibacter ubique]